MTIIDILQYPDPRLKRIGQKVTVFDDALRKIVDDMFETHYAADNCAALANTQMAFDIPMHITVIDFSDKKNEPLCLINAEIIDKRGETYTGEGCMSVPGGIYEKVKRAAEITVRAADQYGKVTTFDADGFMAKCIQHELDHLNGTLFIDHVSPLKRQRLEKRLQKLHKQKRI